MQIHKKTAGLVRRLLSTQGMVKEELRQGEITPTKEAYKVSLAIAAPAVVEMVSMALMDFLSALMVGRVSQYASSAVLLTAQPRMIFFAFLFALNIAVTTIVSRAKGAGEQDTARSCLRHSMMIVLVLGSVMTVLAVAFAQPMMRLAGADADTLAMATSYFRLAGFGLVFQAMTGAICAAQRAIGNTKITMKVSIAAKITQLFVGFLIIEGRFGLPALGVDGAAIALLVVGVVGFGLAIASVLSKDAYLHVHPRDNWRPDKMMLKQIGRVAQGSALEQVALRIGFFLYARVVAQLGAWEFAAHGIGMQIMNISFSFADGISAATASLVGQNLGKRRPDLSIMYGKLGLRLAFAAAAFLSITSFLIRNHFPTLVIPGAPQELVQSATTVITILVFILPIQTTQVVMGGSLRGAGDVRYVAMTMLVTVAILRPLIGWVLVFPVGMGLAGAWVAIIIDQIVRLGMLFTRFSGGKWIRAKL